jgi:hypothetical protein
MTVAKPNGSSDVFLKGKQINEETSFIRPRRSRAIRSGDLRFAVSHS